MEPQFFATPDEFRAWLAANHQPESELLVGYYKKNSGRKSMTWPESVDQALCYGWIDGVRRSIDGEAYSIRFTPRKKGSTWSAVNIKRVGELSELGLMQPAGLRAFEQRKEDNSRIYAYENAAQGLGEEMERIFQENASAWGFFQAQAPSYRKTMTWWVISAKQDVTRHKRLQILIENSANGQKMRDR